MHQLMSRLIPFAILLTTLISCSSSGTTHPDDQSRYPEEATSRARIDAQKAIEAPDGSMARENAILAIHARAHRLEATGDSATARLYLSTAIANLDSAGVFAK